MMAGGMTCFERFTVHEKTGLLKWMPESCLVVLNCEGHPVEIVLQKNPSWLEKRIETHTSRRQIP